MHPHTFTTTEDGILAAVILAALAGVAWLVAKAWPAVVARYRLARQHHKDRKAAAAYARKRAADEWAAAEERHKRTAYTDDFIPYTPPAADDCPHPNHKPTPAYRADEDPEITAQRAGYNNGQRVPHGVNCKCTAKPIIDAPDLLTSQRPGWRLVRRWVSGSHADIDLTGPAGLRRHNLSPVEVELLSRWISRQPMTSQEWDTLRMYGITRQVTDVDPTPAAPPAVRRNLLAGHYLDDDAYENADAYLARVRVLADDERKLRNAQRTIELVTAKGQRRRAAIRRLETRGTELRREVETMRATLAATGHALDAAESERDQARQDAAIAIREYEDRVHAKQQEARWIEAQNAQVQREQALRREVARLDALLINARTALTASAGEVERQAATIRRQQTLIDGANSDKAAAFADRARTIEQALRQQNEDLNTIRFLRKQLRKLESK